MKYLLVVKNIIQRIIATFCRTSGREFKLRFAMKAKSSNGLIFFVSEEENGPHGDYLSIGLRDGFLQMSFNLGSGDATILFNHSRVDDDRWHMVSASRCLCQLHFFFNFLKITSAIFLLLSRIISTEK